MTTFTIPLPTYNRRQQQVSALKIKAIVQNPRGFELHFEDSKFCPIHVDADWNHTWIPSPGEYLVINGDRMECHSAAAFDAERYLVDAEKDRAWSAFAYEWPGGPTEVDAALASRDAEIERLKRESAGKQAEIDRLMLEFCQNEITADQLEEWAKHQKSYQAIQADCAFDPDPIWFKTRAEAMSVLGEQGPLLVGQSLQADTEASVAWITPAWIREQCAGAVGPATQAAVAADLARLGIDSPGETEDGK